jgi:hypothetical protein
LFIGQGVDISSYVGHDLGSDVFAVFFRVRDKLVRGVRLALPVTQEQDRPCWSKRITDLFPILGAVILVRPVGIPRVMRDLVEVASWISSQELGRTLIRRRVGRIENGVMEVDRSDDLLAADWLSVSWVFGHRQSAGRSVSGP